MKRAQHGAVVDKDRAREVERTSASEACRKDVGGDAKKLGLGDFG
jgi:hypothetical protein